MNKKRILSTLFLITLVFGVFAQTKQPITWKTEIKDLGNNEYELIYKASIEDKWHLYSAYIDDSDPTKFPPNPTQFFYDDDSIFANIEDVVEVSEGHTGYDEMFEMDLKYFANEAIFKQKIKLKEKVGKITGYVKYQACDDKSCIYPETATEFVIDENFVAEADNDNPVITNPEESKSMWGLFLAGILGGLLALIMPCLYPMIPLTVSFFTKQGGKGVFNAILYGISIVAIFVGLGLAITLIFGANALSNMASNGFLNFIFFALFVVFALSFFGAFEIRLPSSWINKADKQADKGGLVGIFFMAFTLVLVSFTCTGPIIGTQLVVAATQGDVLGPVIVMLGFSLALAIPFTIFAIFPAWLNSLPQSGGWLNTVKVVLGFLELALALKFLSNVDLAYHWGVLNREIFLSLWIAIFGMTAMYLLGMFRFSHDPETKTLSIPRVLFSLLFVFFTVYLIPGLWGAPVRITSGLLPPSHYKEWKQESHVVPINSENNDIIADFKQYMYSGPGGLTVFKDYDIAIQYARKVNKPVLIDFTGHTCVNCRKMEDYVWVEDRVKNYLQNEYILVSLYVDDKGKLPKDEWFESDASGRMKTMKKVGEKWMDFQVKEYKTNALPYYVPLSPSEEILTQPSPANFDVDQFVAFLQKGLDEFNSKYKEVEKAVETSDNPFLDTSSNDTEEVEDNPFMMDNNEEEVEENPFISTEGEEEVEENPFLK
jgi:thiol:disulfide interchange protein